MTLKRSVQKALVSCDHTKSGSLWPPHLQQWWDVGSRWGSRCVWCTHAWTVCSRRRAAAGKDIGRTAPTAGPHSGASGPEGDATRPPGPRKTYKGERWMWRKIPYTRFNFESVFKMRAKCVFFFTSAAVQVKVVMRCSLSEGMCSEEGSWLTISRYWDRALQSDKTLG